MGPNLPEYCCTACLNAQAPWPLFPAALACSALADSFKHPCKHHAAHSTWRCLQWAWAQKQCSLRRFCCLEQNWQVGAACCQCVAFANTGLCLRPSILRFKLHMRFESYFCCANKHMLLWTCSYCCCCRCCHCCNGIEPLWFRDTS